MRDIHLAQACARGDAAALQVFERDYLRRVPDFIRRVDASDTTASEVQQVLRERLLVGGPHRRPKILDYSGSGTLLSWLRVVAVRVALELRRSKKPEVSDSEARIEEEVVVEDPELEYLRVQYAAQFREAFAAALDTLDDKQRTVLQMHIIDGLNIDRIGVVFQVHRATAARWLASIREQLYSETGRVLQEKLQLRTSDFASVLRLVRSQIDVSVRRILQEGETKNQGHSSP